MALSLKKIAIPAIVIAAAAVLVTAAVVLSHPQKSKPTPAPVPGPIPCGSPCDPRMDRPCIQPMMPCPQPL